MVAPLSSPHSASKGFVSKHTLLIGIALMFALTWPIYAELGLFVGYGLALGALAATALAAGGQGVRALLRRFLIWRVSWRWYAVVLLLPAAIYLGGIALYRLLGGPPIPFDAIEARHIFGGSATPWLFLVPFFLVDAITNGEELGWRGFVLQRLQQRRSALVASLIVGILWGVWHLPKFWAAGDTQLIAYAIPHNVALAILFTWIYNGTGGSLLLATLFHAAFNTAYVFLPVSAAVLGDDAIRIATLAAEYVAAAGVVFLTRLRTLARRPGVAG